MTKKKHETFTSYGQNFCISCGSEHVTLLQTCSGDGGLISALYYCHEQNRLFKISSQDSKFLSDEGYGYEYDVPTGD